MRQHLVLVPRWCTVVVVLVLLVVLGALTWAAPVRVERHERRTGARPTPWVGGGGG